MCKITAKSKNLNDQLSLLVQSSKSKKEVTLKPTKIAHRDILIIVSIEILLLDINLF